MNGNTVRIDRTVKQELCDLAASTYPYECCAALLSNSGGGIDGYCRLTNRSAEASRYVIDPVELYECEKAYGKKGYEIAGFFHSHPDAEAVMSEEDENNAIPSMLYLLASVSKEGCTGMRLWRLDTAGES